MNLILSEYTTWFHTSAYLFINYYVHRVKKQSICTKVLHYSEQLAASVKEDFLGDMKYELHFPGA